MEPVRSPSGEAAPEERPRYASWGQRFAAVFLDGLITFAIALAVVLAFLAVTGDVDALVDAMRSENPEEGAAASRVLGILSLLPWAVAGATYSTYFHGRGSGATPGKMMLGIRVRDDAHDGAIGYGRAFARWLMPALFWLFFYIPGILDGLWPLWDAKNQTWHDKIVGSVVVRD